MDLVLNDEQRMIRDGAASFFREKGGVARMRAFRDAGAVGVGLWSELAGLGWAGLIVPEAYGGTGLGMAEMAVVSEAAGRVLAPEPLLGCAVLGASALGLGGVAAGLGWLSKVAAGEALAALAWDERAMRGETARTQTVARRVGDGWRLDGEKCDVIAGADADVFVVSARREDGAIGLFVVQRGVSGLAVSAQRRVDSVPVGRVVLGGVEVPASAEVGDAGVLEQVLDRGRVAAAAELLGVSGAAFEMTLSYLKERQQFGVAIGTFQTLRHRAARMYIALELVRSAVMAASRALDGVARAGTHAGPRAAMDAAQAVSLAKARASDAALAVADEAVQMHGGIGMTDEHDIGLYFKRARVLAMTLGDGAFHRDRWARIAGY